MGQDASDGGAHGWPTWALESVDIEPFNPAWPARGEELAAKLAAQLSQWLVAGIHHIGSTAVDGLASKPIIDLMAGVESPAVAAAEVANALSSAWHYVPPELDARPWRRFFVLAPAERRIAHLHVVAPDGQRWSELLAFRDKLRANSILRSEYELLKRRLADAHRQDREAYSNGKSQFIRHALAT